MDAPKENSDQNQEKNESDISQRPADFGAGRTVMVVEDDPTSSQLVESILKKHAFNVIPVSNGKEACKTISDGTNPLLVVCDVLMPEMDGLALYKELKNNVQTKDIPVLILTSRKGMEDTFVALGADSFFPKPIDTKKFLETVDRLSARLWKVGVTEEKKEEE